MFRQKLGDAGKKLGVTYKPMSRKPNTVGPESRMGGHIIKKRIRFPRQRKKVEVGELLFADRAFFVRGFAKNEKSNLSSKELHVFKELAKVLLSLSNEKLKITIKMRILSR